MAERVVDQMEGVDVEEEQRPDLPALERIEDPLFHLFYELITVAETAAIDRLSHRDS
jgi:hypothetical protein